jgi:hypothetical protein
VGVDVAIMCAQRNRIECPNLLQNATCKTRNRRLRKLQKLHSCKTGITAQKEPAGDNRGNREDALLEIHNIRSIILCYPLQPSQQKQQQSSEKKIRISTPIKYQVSRRRVKKVNSNTTDMFPAFTMSQNMTELSGAATEKEKFAVTTKALFRLLKNNANNSSQTSEDHSIQC